MLKRVTVGRYVRGIFECEQCKKEFIKPISILRKNGGRCCSQSCRLKYSVGENAAHWKNGKTKDGSGYIEINKLSRREHCIVMEKYIGRPLTKEEIVHHINGIKNDNRIENLQLCENDKEHLRFHSGWWKQDNKWFKICNGCKKTLEVNKENFWQRKQGNFVYLCKKCSYIKTESYRTSNKESRQ